MARPRSTGTVYQRADGKWVAQVYVADPGTGDRRKVRKYATSERAARQLLKSIRDDSAAAAPKTARNDITVVEWLKSWSTSSLPVSGLKPNTIELYRNLIRHPLTPTLGKVKLRLFTPSQADAWLQRLAKQPLHGESGGETISTSTQRAAFNCLKRALDAAVRDGLIEANPLASVARPVARPRPVPVTSGDAVDELLPAVSHLRIGPLVTFVALTGCRVGEAAGLHWEDVDLDAGTATIRRASADSESTKTGTVRTVPLLPEIVASLRELKKRQLEERMKMGPGWADKSNLVFTTGTGTPIDLHNARRDLQRVLASHGMETARPFHSLRHGLASRLLARDVPLPVVSAILGHSSVRVTADVYGHVSPVMHADQVAKALGR